ncbi:tetratricopeptide repeat protein [Ureibacillus terrenus]|uniref:tetratricopeptide repeat protein n=1 Tax=Ureibacillus terrenus TaxID=118246 RepID=UPI002E1ECB37|nr:tetratricopeptide repeat protein [Ureibacillus terrenus]
MSTNEKAIELYERNETRKSLELFHQAVEESRDVQSLNNLAWMYLYEEEDVDRAFELIKEAVEMDPASYFPYNILGEVFIKKELWKEAEAALKKSLSIQPSKEAIKNLAAVYYKLGELELAAKYYLQAAENSNIAMYSHIKCLVDLGRTKEAKEKLDRFRIIDHDTDDHIGAIEIADLYLDLEYYVEAVRWFEKGYNVYTYSPYWIGRFAYALYKLDRISRLDEVIQEAMENTNRAIEEISQEEVSENWTQEQKNDAIDNYTKEYNYYRQLKGRILSGYVPKLEFEPHFTGGCYLFGCKRHGNPEYQGYIRQRG